MSPMMGEMLVKEVMPRLRAAAPSIPKIGCEDNEEITQDATLMAARMMISAEKAGRSRGQQREFKFRHRLYVLLGPAFAVTALYASRISPPRANQTRSWPRM